MAARNTRSEKEKSELMAAMTELLDEKIKTINDRAVLTELLDEKLKPINEKLEKLDSIDNSVGYALEELKKVPDLEINVSNLSKDLGQVKQDLSDALDETKLLKEKLLKQELYSRRNNLKIMGATIGKNDDVESYILRIFQNSGINIQSADIQRAHFVGPLHCNKGRSILVRFLSSKAKM